MTGTRLTLAKGYPYAIPRGSYLYRDGRQEALGGFDPTSRIPVVAFGSNRSPEQLARKYRGWPNGTTIPVTTAWLEQYDVVYSAHFTSYGAMPAMLQPSRGVQVEVAITWLTPQQLIRMHETEGPQNYRFEPLAKALITVDHVGQVRAVFAYLGRRGAFAPDGTAISLAAIPAVGRSGPVLDQTNALGRARDRLAPDADLDPFLLQTIRCRITRSSRNDRLGRLALSPQPLRDST